ncbi:MAG: hypothetical protein HKN74_06730 [Acidimicrobiia bacterium]|nr:hypothetical protein [Acidimicrobiia bacterium]NNF09958.1 hypothetical protein [Acidimicrobiia bacterium]NNL70986.1 hypothetical protein [Acidimicrobiia bacterium]
MITRLRTLGIVLVVVGLVFVVAGGVAYGKVQEGYDSLQSFSESQNVTLSYNEDGQLIDRGTTEGADAIMDLLTVAWDYPVVESDLNPDDPLVNTASEYMYQMATITYHTLHGTQTVVLAEDVEYNGEVFPAGTYEVEVDGKYWTDFDRRHPLEGPARGMAWSGTAHGLIGELGVGTVTHSTLQLGLGVAGITAGVGGFALLAGLGLIWASRAKDGELTFAEMPAAERIPEDIKS